MNKKIGILILGIVLLGGCSKSETLQNSNNNSKNDIIEKDENNVENEGKEEVETPAKTCTPKKFTNPYKYVYETIEECNKESQSTAFFDIVDNVDDRVFTVNCEKIVDDCGTTWYGVSYNVYDPDNSSNADGVVVVHY